MANSLKLNIIVAFERYGSEIDLWNENFKRLTSTFVDILKNCPEKWVNGRSSTHVTEISYDVLTICCH